MSTHATVKFAKVAIKKSNNRERFHNELFFYKTYPEFAPKLLGYDITNMTLFIEKWTPMHELPMEESIKFKPRLWNLLEKLHKNGANHRDVAITNVVVKGEEVRLIDWEVATQDIKEMSMDLYGAETVGMKLPKGYEGPIKYGPQGIWWGGPWDISPGRYWP